MSRGGGGGGRRGLPRRELEIGRLVDRGIIRVLDVLSSNSLSGHLHYPNLLRGDEGTWIEGLTQFGDFDDG